jgi:CRISPR-associated endonuclease/helicase Cas3
LKEGRKEGFRRSVVVFNTVDEAVKFYEIARERSDIEKSRVLLVHSRFTGEDREEKRRRIEELKRLDEYLIVATHVIEAGVDISSDLFISDLAPASSLIQRLGRFLRYDEKEGKIYLWYEDEKREKYKGVYYLDLLGKNSGILGREEREISRS